MLKRSIMSIMHNDFYASGFLYHPKSQRILLQKEKKSDLNNSWKLICVKSKKNETSKDAFSRLINSLFKLEIEVKNIISVYDYFHDELKANNFISFAKVKKAEEFISKNYIYQWFDIRETLKLKVSPQTKQDIIVLQRVISSSVRKENGEKYID